MKEKYADAVEYNSGMSRFSVAALVIVGIAIAGGAAGYYLGYGPWFERVIVGESGNKNGGSACTQEAKLCPDGTAVGRVGPTCEFAACPVDEEVIQGKSGAKGTISRGPICPVEQYPPDPACADKPVQGEFIVKNTAGTKEIARFRTDAEGRFLVFLPPGEYSVEPNFPIGLPGTVGYLIQVPAQGIAEYSISFDTGIR